MPIETLFDDSCCRLRSAGGFPLDPSLNSLWFFPTGHNFEPEDWATITSLVQATKMLLWHVSDGGTFSPRIKAHRRAFGTWKGLSKNVVKTSDIENPTKHTTYYSDVALATKEDIVELSSFSSRSMFGIDSAIVISPPSVSSAVVSQCFRMSEQFFFARQSASTIRRTAEMECALTRYLDTALDHGAAPSLVFRDSNCDPLIAVVGLDRFVALDIVSSLSSRRRILDMFARGLDLAAFA